MKKEVLKFEIIGEFLEEIKKEFGGENKESKKIVKLKKLEQGQWTMEKFIQMFRKAASSGCGKQALIEEFKREMDRRIRKRLMEVECPLKSINQWYK